MAALKKVSSFLFYMNCVQPIKVPQLVYVRIGAVAAGAVHLRARVLDRGTVPPASGSRGGESKASLREQLSV